MKQLSLTQAESSTDRSAIACLYNNELWNEKGIVPLSYIR